ncbi:MAG: hypothetical protein Q4G69_10325 [Planctomycetia bacterium]|nr:hypothetical protein [Planctomycetia bacterium]
MKFKNRLREIFVLMFLSITPFLCGAELNKARIIPIEEGAIQNAGIGTEIWNGGPSAGYSFLVKYAVELQKPALNSMIRVSWRDYEKEEGVYLFEQKMDPVFRTALKYNQKLNVGVFMCDLPTYDRKIDTDLTRSDEEIATMQYPQYVHEAMQKSADKDQTHRKRPNDLPRWVPNYKNDYFFQRYDALLKAFSEYLEGGISFEGKTVARKKLIRIIEIRFYGTFGEGLYSDPFVPEKSEYLIRFAKLYLKYFPDIRLAAPTLGMMYLPELAPTSDYLFFLLNAKNKAGAIGLFRDNWGDNDDMNMYRISFYKDNKFEKDGKKMFELIRDRWKTAPMLGEPGKFQPKKGENGFFIPYHNIIEQVSYLHPACIRNCNVSVGVKTRYNSAGFNIKDDPIGLANWHWAYSLMGFRMIMVPQEAQKEGSNLKIALGWENIGLTPVYDRWTIKYFAEDQNGKEIWKQESSLNIQKIYPNGLIPPGKFDPEKMIPHRDTLIDFPIGHDLYLRIEDPDGISPPMALSIDGRRKDGSYFIGRID